MKQRWVVCRTTGRGGGGVSGGALLGFSITNMYRKGILPCGKVKSVCGLVSVRRRNIPATFATHFKTAHEEMCSWKPT